MFHQSRSRGIDAYTGYIIVVMPPSTTAWLAGKGTKEQGVAPKAILFFSWQGGLGHITRDLAIVKSLHQLDPACHVSWMAHPLACRLLEQAGETILPESQLGADYNQVAFQAIRSFKLNLMMYIGLSQKAWAHNVRLFIEVLANHHFDLVIGDESYEILDAMGKNRVKLDPQW